MTALLPFTALPGTDEHICPSQSCLYTLRPELTRGRAIQMSKLVLKEYSRGMVMCEAALYDSSTRSRLMIQRTSKFGQLLEISGDVYRRIRQQASTLNENADVKTFLKRTGYYHDTNLLESSAATYKVCE